MLCFKSYHEKILLGRSSEVNERIMLKSLHEICLECVMLVELTHRHTFVKTMFMVSGVSQPYGPSWSVTGIALPFTFYSKNYFGKLQSTAIYCLRSHT
jgi:hypothetical protein